MSNKTNFILEYLFVVLLGTLLHFLYELSGKNAIVALFCPINESTWEHLKLLFFPMLLLTIQNLFTDYGKSPNFFPARITGILSGFSFIIIAFYTFTGVIGNIVEWLNIAIFLFGTFVTFWVEKKRYSFPMHKGKFISKRSAILILFILILLFILFTVAPPNIGLFRVPNE